MIYLIGGVPKCGKTTLAKKLSERIGVSWISADTLQNIVKVHTPREELSDKFPSSSHRTSSNDERFSKYSSTELVEQYLKQARTSYTAIKTVVETYLVDKDDFIIEGYQVTPKLVHQLFKEFGAENIKAVFLIKKDADKFLKNLHKSSTPNDWVLQRTKDNQTFSRIAKMIAEYSSGLEIEALKYHLAVKNMDDDFDEKIDQMAQDYKWN